MRCAGPLLRGLMLTTGPHNSAHFIYQVTSSCFLLDALPCIAYLTMLRDQYISIHINTNYIYSHSLGVFVMRKALQEVESAESDEGSVWSFQRRLLFFHFNSDQLLVEQLIKHVMAGPELAQLAAILHSNSAQVRRCNTFAVRENENKTMERKIDQLRTQLMNPMNQALMKQRKWFEARTCQTLQWEHHRSLISPLRPISPHQAIDQCHAATHLLLVVTGCYW